MHRKLMSRADLLRRTAGIIAISVGSTIVIGGLMSIILFGGDPHATVSVGFAAGSTLVMGIVLSAALAGGLSYRSGRLLQQLMRAQAELVRVSRTDQLTGLLNRRGFDETAAAILADAREANLPVVALMCDIDHFKAINDRHGHEFGDAVLTQIGEVFRTFAARNEILVARHGGEEFAALIVGPTADEVAPRAELLRQMCAAREISHKGTTIHATVSIGIAASHGEADLSAVMRAADDALYLAKHRGRNCVAMAESFAWQLELLPAAVPARTSAMGKQVASAEMAAS